MDSDDDEASKKKRRKDAVMEVQDSPKEKKASKGPDRDEDPMALQEKKVKKEAKLKKELKKAKKLAKKEKKLAKKEAKKAKKLAKKAKKKGSSSSSSSSDSDLGLNFVLDIDYGKVAGDRQDPDAKVRKALGLPGSYEFVKRDDDEQIAKEVGGRDYCEDSLAEDRSRDWVCQKVKANGEICGMRNFVKNDKCFGCNSLRPKTAVTMKQAGDIQVKHRK